MNQLIMGALLPYLISAVVYLRRRGRATLRQLTLTPLAMAAGAFWAVAPDLPRVLGREDLYDRLARERWTDVFLAHYSIDHVEAGWPESPLFTLAFVLMAVSLVAAAWRELKRLEDSP